MDQCQLLSDILKSSNRAVSPVIATILVVAITVILAAVIGATAFGFADSFTDSPPQANLQAEEETVTINQDVESSPSFNAANDKDFRAVTITHTSGDDIDKDKIRVTVNGKEAYATSRPPQDFYDITTGDRNDPIRPWDTAAGDSITSGDSTTIVLGTDIMIDNGFQPGDNAIVFATGGDNLVQYGTELITESDGARLSSGDTVRMIWESGDQSVPLFEYEVS